MDTSERRTGDGPTTPGPRLLPETSGLLLGRHGDAPPLSAPGRGVYRPQEPQVCHEAPVGDLCVGRETQRNREEKFK